MMKQPKKKADLMMHPVRMKIIQHLAKGEATVSELAKWLNDVPQATLYRHLNTLRTHDVIHVVGENRVRGTIERTYALRTNASRITADEAAQMSSEEHMEVFMAFIAELIRHTETYVEGDPDFDRDLFGYAQLDLYLTESETEAFRRELGAVLKTYGQLPKRDGTRKVTMAQLFIPEANDE